MAIKIRCVKCRKLLPHTYKFFSFHKPGYLRSKCMVCERNYAKEYYHKNKNSYKKRASIRKKSKIKTGGNYTKKDIEKIRINLDDKCAYCNKLLKGKGHIDHLKPVAKGGSSFPKNLTLACSWCNHNKWAKTENEFLLWRKECGLKNRIGIKNGRKITTKSEKTSVNRLYLNKSAPSKRRR